MIEWIVGAVLVGAVVLVVRSSSGSTTPSPAPTPNPAPVPNPVPVPVPLPLPADCDVRIAKFLSGLNAANVEEMNTIFAKGDPTKVEAIAVVVEDLDPKLAACIRSFKKKG